MRRSVSRFVIGILLGVISLSCAQSHDNVETGALRDDFGDPVALDRRPSRIVSLNPTTTEIIFAIGASDRLVGRSHWDEWPDSALLVQDLGPALRPNVEAILAVHPDLVVLYASLDNRPAAQRLREAGIQTISYKIDRIKEFDAVTRLLGRITGDSARADAVADSVMQTLDRVRRATARLDHPTVVWPFSYRPTMVVGGGSYMTALLEIAGARNVYADLSQPSPVVTLEDVVRRNPRYVIRSVDQESRATQPKTIDPAWQAVPAVREGRLLYANPELVARPSLTMGQAVVELARLLHPGIEIQ